MFSYVLGNVSSTLATRKYEREPHYIESLEEEWCSLIYPFNHSEEQGDAASSTCAHGGQSFPSPSP